MSIWSAVETTDFFVVMNGRFPPSFSLRKPCPYLKFKLDLAFRSTSIQKLIESPCSTFLG